MRQMFLFQADQIEQQDAQVLQAGRARSGAGCRIRERVMKEGPEALGSLEHLSVLLGEHDTTKAKELITYFGSLAGLARAPFSHLCRVISEGQALSLLSALRFASEVTLEKASKDPISTPTAVERLLGEEIRRADRERLVVLLLNAKYCLIKKETVSIGSLNEALAHPREVFKPAIAHSAHSIVVVHNHPSGDPSPSEADIRLTRRLNEASRLLQIPLLDHVIIGQRSDDRTGYFSFREGGIIS